MRPNIEKNYLFQASQLTILVSYTVFSAILTAETFLMDWETWPLIPIFIGIVVSWIMHLRQSLTADHRVWIYSAFIMFTFFFYGSHRTSVFDTVSVMSVVLILYTMTGMKPLITFLQMLYYITMAYGLTEMWLDGETFDSLVISRSLLHIAVITAIGIISRKIINKWKDVLGSSSEEIEKLTEATERLNDFLANVSHEIRTPINAVIGLTGICINEEEDPEKLENLTSVRSAGRRVAEQISDILDYTEIDSGKLANNYEDYMLSSVLGDLVAEIRPYKPEELELVIDVDPAIPSVMNTDISKLKKILRHLIINGLKYTPEGGVYVRLYTIPQEYGVNLLIKVTDTGIGMSQEETERIFDSYYQADSGRTRQGGGLGLGLTIAAGFTASLGGFMRVESVPDEGTTVTVSLPQNVVESSSCMSLAEPEKLCLGAFLHLDKYADPHVREYYNMMIHNIVVGFGIQMHRVDNVGSLKKLLDSVTLTHLFIAEEEYETAPGLIEELARRMTVVVVANGSFRLKPGSSARIMEKPFYCFPVAAVLNSPAGRAPEEKGILCPGVKALVVDDEPMNLVVAKNILKRYGMTVTTAVSGQESIDLCRSKQFDIVFMDHMMPGMDGVEAMKLIRAGKVRGQADTPIVALTANAVSTAKEMFLSEGFDGFVSKPIELVELERVLKKVLPRSVITSEDGEALPEETAEEAPADEAPADEAPAEAELSLFEKLEALGINTAEGMGYCMDDEELYSELLMQFVNEAPSKRLLMEEAFAAEDLKNYAIYVHGLKSTSRMIGDGALGSQAEALEFASKDGNAEFVREHHPGLMEDYLNLTEGISKAYGTVPSSEDPEKGGE
ncbi:Signal transduction histidine kinase [Ruminococcaceae bacterium FB2012]|nr:Signal transduction histidine kinase [Ruminococcaceae bacterium FB2012]